MELLGEIRQAAGSGTRERINLAFPFAFWVQFTKHTNEPNHLLRYDRVNPSRRELEAIEIANYLTPLFEMGLNASFIEGGEPLVRPDWQELTRFIAKHAFTILRTNGTLLTASAVDTLSDAGVGVVCVDLQAAVASEHDRVTGLPGSFDEAVRGIRRLVDAKVPTYILSILTQQSAGQLQAILDLAASLGVQKVGVLRLYPIGSAQANWPELAMSLADQMQALGSLRAPPSVKLMQSWHPHNPNCCWQIAAVDAYGDSIGCPYLRDRANYGNVSHQPFLDTWNIEEYVNRRNVVVKNACTDCQSNDPNAEGGCRSTAYAFTGQWDAGDPFCEKMNNGIDLTARPTN